MDQTVLDNPETTEEVVPSLRDTIEAAVEEHAPAEPEVKAKPSTEVTPPVGDPNVLKPAVADPNKPAVVDPNKPAVVDPNKPAVPQELNAPKSWRPTVREKWKGLPREVQEEILRREGDNLRLIGTVGSKIKFADDVGQHIQPFAERLQSNGATPQEFIGDVFQTIRNLVSPDQQLRAETIANVIQAYGVDLKALDAVLARRLQQPPEVRQYQTVAMQAQRQVQRYQSQVQSGNEARAQADLEAFATDPKNEFFNDVRHTMADLIDAGHAKTLEEAYQSAIWANSDTRKILLQREAEARVATKTTRAANARRASASINGVPRAPHAQVQAVGNPNMSLRDTIAAAMDAQESA